MASAIELESVRKVFPGGVEAVAGVDLRVGPGEYFVVVGPSGSGKSTLLRLVAGLETLTGGRLRIGGRDVTDRAPRERGVAMVFQHPALYPHLTVRDNLAFGPRARGAGRSEVRARVEEVAAALGVDGLLERRPATLSGGQRQRVALGRALATRPAVYLLDEPLSALDPPLRASLRDVLKDLRRLTEATFLHVTHDQAEALALGDRLGVMEQGRLAQVGDPRAVYDRPASRSVGRFVGSPPMVVVRCEVEEGPRLVARGHDTPPTSIEVASDRFGPWTGRTVELGLRAEHVVRLDDGRPPGADLARLSGPLPVVRLEYLGHETVAELALGGATVPIRLPAGDRVRPGDRLLVGLDLARASWFDPATGAAL